MRSEPASIHSYRNLHSGDMVRIIFSSWSGGSPRLSCAAAVAIAALCFGVGCDRHETPLAAAQDRSSSAEQTLLVTEAKMHPWPRVVRAQGSLAEDEQALLGAKVAGRIKEVAIDLGTAVKEDQTIAVLEAEEFDLGVQQAEAQVGQARAALGLAPGEAEDALDLTKAAPVLQEKALLEEARFNVTRRKSLKGKGVITTEELQQFEALLRVAEAKYESALNSVHANLALLAVRKAELATARQTLSDAIVKAPFAGVIEAKHVAPGSFVNIGDPVATLVRTNPLRFRAAIPERSSTRIRVGQNVRVFVEGETAPVDAQVSRVSPSLDLASRSLVIEADVDNTAGRFRTGLFAEAEIIVDENSGALAVPEASIVAFAGVEKVWVVRDGTARGQRIRPGRRENGLVEIIEGLQPGDVVLADGEQGREGPVRIAGAPSSESAAILSDSSITQ
jgi:RND family efflux transporter MFP subunit